jgi:hypothetical protein
LTNRGKFQVLVDGVEIGNTSIKNFGKKLYNSYFDVFTKLLLKEYD